MGIISSKRTNALGATNACDNCYFLFKKLIETAAN